MDKMTIGLIIGLALGTVIFIVSKFPYDKKGISNIIEMESNCQPVGMEDDFSTIQYMCTETYLKIVERNE